MRCGFNSMANCCDCEEFKVLAKTSGVVAAAADMHTQMVKRVVTTTTTTSNRLIISTYLLYLAICLSVCVCGVKSLGSVNELWWSEWSSYAEVILMVPLKVTSSCSHNSNIGPATLTWITRLEGVFHTLGIPVGSSLALGFFAGFVRTSWMLGEVCDDTSHIQYTHLSLGRK